MVDTHLKVMLSTLDLDLSKNEDDNKPRTYYAQPNHKDFHLRLSKSCNIEKRKCRDTAGI